jgi:hypothetical protein
MCSTATPRLKAGALQPSPRRFLPSGIPPALRVGSLIPNPLVSAGDGAPVRLDAILAGRPAVLTARRPDAGPPPTPPLDGDVAAATRFDPVTSAWTNVTTPAGWTNVGDAPLCVLADGRVLMGNISSTQTAFFDPVTGTFSAGPDKSDQCSEESFVLLPDGTVLAVDCTSIPNAEKYLPATNEWVPAGSTPSTLPQACPTIVAEIGPTVVLPDGNALAIGATGNTAIYMPPTNPSDPGTWQPGPTITDGSGNPMYPMDAPAVLLPNGRVLLTASPAPPCSFPGPTSFFEYDPTTNGLTPVTSPSNASNGCFTGRFLLLPNGQVLFSSESAEVTIYTPDGMPDPSWKPAISGVPAFMAVGNDYALSGTQFNGLSQACMYGDDATMATNYPVARLEQGTSVIYCRTAHHSTMGLATGSEPVSTVLSIPPAVPPGGYDLVVVANGIASDPVPVTIAAQAGLGDIIELGLAQGGTWQQNNLTAAITPPLLPTTGAAPFAYVTPDGTARVLYRELIFAVAGPGLGQAHDIIELSLPQGGTWQQNNLTAITGAAYPSGALFAYVGPDEHAGVLYTGVNGDITELRLDPDGWVQSDLTISVNNPPAPPAASAPFAYVTPDKVDRVYYSSSPS